VGDARKKISAHQPPGFGEFGGGAFGFACEGISGGEAAPNERVGRDVAAHSLEPASGADRCFLNTPSYSRAVLSFGSRFTWSAMYRSNRSLTAGAPLPRCSAFGSIPWSVIRGCDLSTGPEGLQIEFREAFLAGRFVSDVALERIRDDTADRGQLVGHFENAGSIGVAHQPPGAGSFTPAVGASQ